MGCGGGWFCGPEYETRRDMRDLEGCRGGSRPASLRAGLGRRFVSRSTLRDKRCWILECTSAIHSSFHSSFLPRLSSPHITLSCYLRSGSSYIKTDRDQHSARSSSSPSTSSLGRSHATDFTPTKRADSPYLAIPTGRWILISHSYSQSYYIRVLAPSRSP